MPFVLHRINYDTNVAKKINCGINNQVLELSFVALTLTLAYSVHMQLVKYYLRFKLSQLIL